MLSALSTVLAVCTMASCVTLVSADDTTRPNSGGNSGLSDGRSGDGPRDHGFEGERWQDRVPREPMWFINAGPGVRNSSVHPEDNARGLAVWWRGDHAVDNLVQRIQTGYGYGARWFFINRPMGTPGNTHVPGASWLTMDQNKRDNLPNELTQALLDEFDEPVHVVWFVGSDMSDPREYSGWTQGRDSLYYQIGQGDNWEQLIGSRVTLGGWISTGASGIAIDHSSPLGEREHFIRLFEQLNQFPFNLAIYGEAYPLVYENGRIARDDDRAPLLDQEAIRSMPWIATDAYIEGQWTVSVETETFALDENDTRMFVWFSRTSLIYGGENQRKNLVHTYMDRNLIPITSDPVMFREALDRLRQSESANSYAPPGSGSHRNSTRTYQERGQRSTPGVPSQELPERYKPQAKGIR